MFVEDLLCEQEDNKSVVLLDSDLHDQYNKVIILHYRLCMLCLVSEQDFVIYILVDYKRIKTS